MPIGGVNPNYGQDPSWFSKPDQSNSKKSSQLQNSPWSNASTYRDRPRDTSYSQRITAHGAPFAGETCEDSKIIKSGKEVANYWANNVNSSTKHIDLHSCYSANGGAFSNAQMLANRTGLPVTGYFGKMSHSSGNSSRFEPQSRLTAAWTGAINNTVGGLVSLAISSSSRDTNQSKKTSNTNKD